MLRLRDSYIKGNFKGKFNKRIHSLFSTDVCILHTHAICNWFNVIYQFNLHLSNFINETKMSVPLTFKGTPYLWDRYGVDDQLSIYSSLSAKEPGR